MARKKHKKIYTYECSITGERFKMTKESKNPAELVSVRAYYEMHPERDDRPEIVKKRIALQGPVELSPSEFNEEAEE